MVDPTPSFWRVVVTRLRVDELHVSLEICYRVPTLLYSHGEPFHTMPVQALVEPRPFGTGPE
jgi:hypothetical protein